MRLLRWLMQEAMWLLRLTCLAILILLKNTLAAFGVECRCCDLTNMDEVRAQVDEHTCALFWR